VTPLFAAALIFLLVASDDPEFASPQSVTITGYSGDAMEPFLTKWRTAALGCPGQARAPVLHKALQGANSPALDAVATVDSDGNIYFVTTRSYDQDFMTIYHGHFERGVVSDVMPVSGISRGVRGQVNFDVEVSADGNTLYFTDGLFTGGPVPAQADLAIAVRGSDGQFHRTDGALLASINTSALEYAACISEDQLELFFTRIVDGQPGIFRSTRPDRSSPWGTPRRLSAIVGFAEAPTISPGGSALYYHALRNGRMVIERVSRRSATKRRAVRH